MKKTNRKLLKFTLLTLILTIIMFGSMLSSSAVEDCSNGTCNHSAVITVDQTYMSFNSVMECKRICKIIFSEGVTDIYDGFAYHCYNLEEVNFPSTVNSIGPSAFRGTKISSVILPEGLTRLGGGAFMECKNLTDVYIPSTFKTAIYAGDLTPFEDTNVKNLTIGSQELAVSELGLEGIETLTLTEHITDTYEITGWDSLDIDECPNLQAIYVDENNPYYSSEDGVLFNKAKTEIIFYPPQKTDTEYKIPDSVKTIRAYCFKNNDYLKKVNLPASLKLIETEAFSVPIEELSTIPKTTEKISANAFIKHNLTDVYFEGTTAEWEKITIHEELEFPSGIYVFDSFNPEVDVHCNGDTEPEPPDEPEIPENHTHSFTSGVVVDATCTEDGVMSLSCQCGYSFAEIIPAKGHKDENGDFKCDNDGCDYEYEKPNDDTPDCTCNCHKTGFMGFIWKILRIFYKLFKINPVCACGTAHY